MPSFFIYKMDRIYPPKAPSITITQGGVFQKASKQNRRDAKTKSTAFIIVLVQKIGRAHV